MHRGTGALVGAAPTGAIWANPVGDHCGVQSLAPISPKLPRHLGSWKETLTLTARQKLDIVEARFPCCAFEPPSPASPGLRRTRNTMADTTVYRASTTSPVN